MWYAAPFLRTLHGRYGLSEAAPAPVAAPVRPVTPPYVKDSTEV